MGGDRVGWKAWGLLLVFAGGLACGPAWAEEPVVTKVQLSPASLRAGASYTAIVSGSGLTSQTFIDVTFRRPGSDGDEEAANWQRGPVASHQTSAEDRKSTRLNSSHSAKSRMPSSA